MVVVSAKFEIKIEFAIEIEIEIEIDNLSCVSFGMIEQLFIVVMGLHECNNSA